MNQMIEPLWEQAAPIDQLHQVPAYFPLTNGRYEVKPGMVTFGTDFGNGKVDQQVFQFDENFAHYRQMKLQARQERLSKYVQTCRLLPEVERTIAQFIIDRLLQEHPHWFKWELQSPETAALQNQLTQETLILDRDYQLRSVVSPQPPNPPYQSTWDALACQLQEDFAVVSRHLESHWISAIHLCFPNHWAAEAAIGKDFAQIHAPVAGMAAINRRGAAIVHTMIAHRPTVRFAWGLTTDRRLNHHPDPPTSVSITDWTEQPFNPEQPQLFLRIERQVIWGFPAVNAALFTIRTYFRDCQVVRQDQDLRSKLCGAIRSMSSASLTYKRLASCQQEILTWLEKA